MDKSEPKERSESITEFVKLLALLLFIVLLFFLGSQSGGSAQP
jgi:hypothetical protein